MSTSSDVEKIDEKISDDDLVKIIRQKPNEESVLLYLKELSRRKSPMKLEVFREVVADPRQSMRAKRDVITELGTERVPQNQTMLLEQLPGADKSLFPSIVHSLSKIGDEAALKQLEGISAPEEPTASASLEFARSLLAYRLRLDRHLIKTPAAAQLVKLSEEITFETARAKTETVRLANAHVRKDLPAIPLAEAGAASLTCRTNELLLVFSDEFKQPRSLRTIGQRPSLPLVLLKKGLSLDRYTLASYFFTQPAKDSQEIDLLGVRPGGDLTYAGKVQISESVFTFALGAVETRYAPAIEVEGTYDVEKRTWQFSKAMTSLTVAAQKDQAVTPRKVSPNFNGG
jgi:hypothetical protein